MTHVENKPKALRRGRVTLLPDWKHILTKAWSAKFTILAAVLSGVEVYVAFAQPAVPSGLFAVFAAMASSFALIARVLMQKEFQSDRS